ncbi:MAG: hypothetical protein K2L67_02945 [Clostridia bacterium]|nr:hypothetical protein [Clostridia bacterium]
MREFLTIGEIEERLQRLSMFAVRQVADAVGVKSPSKYSAAELRRLILGIAKGEAEQVPKEKRRLAPEKMTYNGDVAAAVIYLAEKRDN